MAWLEKRKNDHHLSDKVKMSLYSLGSWKHNAKKYTINSGLNWDLLTVINIQNLKKKKNIKFFKDFKILKIFKI